MANYKDIKGFNVQTLSSDPAASIGATGTWASTPNINTGRMELFGTGPGTAGMVVNGTPDGSDGAQVYDCEVYNGSAWTEVNNTDQRRQDGASAGVTTSALVTAGYTTSPRGNSAFTETFNGTTWTEETNISNGIQGRRGLGASENASLIVSAAPSNNCELWNGSSWTEKNNQNTARSGQGTFGTTTAGIGAGGNPYRAIVESFDGTSWTEVGDINTGRQYPSGGGIQTAGLIFGGTEPPNSAKTEIFDGTSWTEVGDLGTARYYGAGGGTQTSSIFAGGAPTSPSSVKSSSEEWSTASSLTKINEGQVYYNSTSDAFKVSQYNYPAGTFAAGGNMNQKRYQIEGCGNQTAALVAGGDTYNDSPRATADSETYNGTAWTEGNDLNEGTQGSHQAGTTSAAVLTYENSPYGTELYNGTSWSDNPSTLNTGRNSGAMGGVQTAALFCGGSPPTTAAVEEFNGSSCSETTDLNTARGQAAAVGVTTSMLVTGGDVPPYSALTETYDGTSWTETGDLPIGKSQMGIIGSTGAAMVCMGGLSPPGGPSGIATGAPSQSLWNGTTWTAGSGYPAQYRGGGGCGPAATGVFMGGIGTPNDSVTTTNEWTASLTNKTITVS